MRSASRNLSLLPLASSLAVRALGLHVDGTAFMRGLSAATGIAHVATRWHVAVNAAEQHFRYQGFADMARPQGEALQPSAEASQQQHPEQQSHGAHAQHQGFSVPTPAASKRPSTGFKKTFYKRKLPTPPAIEFSSPEGRQLFQEALLDGSMVGFFKLMEQFNTQDEPAFCGLASLAMVLNALSIDPRRTWKGSWRWFHEAMLDCCRPLDVVKEEGITLYQASCLARCNGARVEVRPHGATPLEQFRAEVEAVCRSGEEHIVVSYSRKAFLQTGDGHFSPIGGYHRGRDLVLVLDVARFKYPPHWVPLPLLYHAMSYTDPETGRPRGYMRLCSNPLLDSVLLTLDIRSGGWRRADAFVRAGAPLLVRELAARGGLTGEDIVRQVVDAMPLASLDAFLVVRSGAPLAAAARDAAAAAAGPDAVPEGLPCATPDAMAAAVRQASEVGNAAAAADAAASAGAGSGTSPRDLGDAMHTTTAAVTTTQTATAAAASAAVTATLADPATAAAATATDRDADVLDHVMDPFLRPPHSHSRPTAHHGSLSKPAPCSAVGGGASGSGGGGSSTKTGGGASKGCGGGCGSGSGGGCGSSSSTSTSTSTTSSTIATAAATTTAAAASSTSSGSPSGGAPSNSSLMAAATAVFTARDRCVPLGQRQQLLDELRGMPLYGIVAQQLVARAAAGGEGVEGVDAGVDAGAAGAGAASPQGITSPTSVTSSAEVQGQGQQPGQPQPQPQYLAEKVVMALLMLPPDAWPDAEAGGWRDAGAGAQWQALMGAEVGYSVVEAEAAYLREQLAHIDEVLQSGELHGTCGEHSSRLDCAAHGH